MKILITGISGFLGSHLAERLSKEHLVAGLYHSKKPNFDGPLFADADTIDFRPNVLVMCHAAVSSGNHQASPDELSKVNIGLTQKLVSGFPDAKKIYISSVSVFGNYRRSIDENTPTDPATEYAVSKFQGEEIVKNDGGTIIRLSSLFGRGMKENTLIPNYCRQALENGTIEVWGDGRRMQNYFHVSDAVAMIEAALDAEVGMPLLGVSAKEFSNLEIARIIAHLTGANIRHVGNDASLSFKYDNSLTQKALNWAPVADLPAAIEDYLIWKKQKPF